MNPLTEQRVHLSGNPIKSQGEMLLCLPLIIASLPCTAATALLLEIYWDSGAGGWGSGERWAGGGKEKGERETFSLCTQRLHVALHAPHLLDFFVPLLPLLLLLLPFLSFSFSFSLPVSLPPSPPLPSQFLF